MIKVIIITAICFFSSCSDRYIKGFADGYLECISNGCQDTLYIEKE